MDSPQRTILYIEDDDASRGLVERTLRYAGYRILVAERGLRGVDLARIHTPDLILVDLSLPDISGHEVTTLLRRDPRFTDTPIVALTAHDINEQRETAFAAGLTGFLTKPFDVEALPSHIEYYLAGGRDTIDPNTLSAAQTRYTGEVAARLESRIRELEAVNLALSRLDAMKDSFIQLTAHELRTPFTLVYGYHRLLIDNPELRDQMRRDPNLQTTFEGMNHAVERMRTIITEILTVSRIMTNKIDLSIGPTDLGMVVLRAIRPYVPALHDRRITIYFEKKEWPEKMQADWDLLELVINNLVSNAIKYTPDGGRVTLRARADTERVVFSIKDTGIGIAKEVQKGVFERFASSSDPALHSTSKTAFRGGGIGLGLAISKGIIEEHGGKIWMESPGYDPERLPGSEFFVVLPLIARRAESASQR